MDEPGAANLRDWFEENELDTCPFCGEKSAVWAESKIAVCLHCEVVWVKDGEPRRL
jgi:hypothetical protein